MNSFLLDSKMREKGVTNEKMANLLDIDPATFYRKKKGVSEFTRKEIQIIRKVLCLTHEEVDLIFFIDVLT